MMEIKPIDPDREFYGVDIVIDPDGRETVTYCGGFAPRPLTETELRPWLELAASVEKGESTCIAA
jgi:hypothetical protein